MQRFFQLLFASALALAPLSVKAAAPDSMITFTIQGTLGPVISGSDPLGISGSTAVLTATLHSSATPTGSTSDSATYTLPAGSVTLQLGALNLTSSGPFSLKITLRKDKLVIS